VVASAKSAASASGSAVVALSSETEAVKPATTPEESRKPIALDDAAKRTATAYLAALARGRKATTGKDFAKAETEFSACLRLVPRDPRALGERGYARLLAGKLDDADADLKAAAEKAGSTGLLLQLVHNRLLVARKRGDVQAAEGFEADKKRLKDSRRIAPGIDCTSETRLVPLSPERPKTLLEAWKLVAEAHAAAVQMETKPEEIALGSEGPAEGAPPAPPPSEAELWQKMTGGTPRDGGWALTTATSNGSTLAGHALFSKAGQLYVFPALYHSTVFRCGQDGGGVLTVDGGGVVPWHIKLEEEQLTAAYTCGAEPDDGRFGVCGTAEDPGGPPVGSFCTLASSTVTLTVLDSKSFASLFEIVVGVQPSGDKMMGQSPHLLDVEWLPDHLVVSACGSRQQVPYSLGSE
jgi:Flp pilus assembly protein TadD